MGKVIENRYNKGACGENFIAGQFNVSPAKQLIRKMGPASNRPRGWSFAGWLPVFLSVSLTFLHRHAAVIPGTAVKSPHFCYFYPKMPLTWFYEKNFFGAFTCVAGF